MPTETPTGDDYATLADMAREYRDTHIVELKRQAHYNPRLGVDALCFQRLSAADDEPLLVGALITPCALWLVALAADTDTHLRQEDDYRLSLPSGDYRLTYHAFGERWWYQRCVLDDLAELDSMEDAARLAQQLMARLMEA